MHRMEPVLRTWGNVPGSHLYRSIYSADSLAAPGLPQLPAHGAAIHFSLTPCRRSKSNIRGIAAYHSPVIRSFTKLRLQTVQTRWSKGLPCSNSSLRPSGSNQLCVDDGVFVLMPYTHSLSYGDSPPCGGRSRVHKAVAWFSEIILISPLIAMQ